MTQIPLRVAFILLLLLPSIVVWEVTPCLAEESAQTWIQRGKKLSDNDQHQEAVKAFHRASRLDPTSEMAYLNLGNSLYELESYKAASAAFERVLKINPDNSTALFYLGLTRMTQKEYTEAISYFEKAASLDSDYEQLSLFFIGRAHSEMGNLLKASENWRRAVKVNPTTDIARKTGTLINKLTQKKPGKKRWSMSMSTGVEYDDNVTVSLQDLATGLDDFAYFFEFSGTYKFLENEKIEIEAGYDFYQSLYESLSEFDLQSHIFSLSSTYKFAKFDFDVNTSYNRSTLGGEDFLETYSIGPQVGFFLSESWFALFGYSYEDTQFFTDSSRDSKNHGVGTDHFIFFDEGKSYLLFSYRFESKITRGPEFTYLGHFGTAGLKTPLPFLDKKGSINLAYRFFHKNYNNQTPSLGRERYDLRHTFQVTVTQPITKCLDLIMNYEFIDSVSNLKQTDFTENIASVALSISF